MNLSLLTVFLVFIGALSAHAIPISEQEGQDLTFMVEEEKLARDVYLLLGQKYSTPVLVNIPKSEQRHMEALGGLLRAYDLPNPTDGKAVGFFEDLNLQALFNSLVVQGQKNITEAFTVGALIEETDMKDLSEVMIRTNRAEILSVYENLMCGSRNHLRAFVKNLNRINNLPYKAQVMKQSEVDEILTKEHEKCGQH